MGRSTSSRVKDFTSFVKQGLVLSIEQQLDLIRLYMRKEVKEAMFQIDKNKSPGPDGYGSEVFRSAWSIVGADRTTTILEFFWHGKLLKQRNTTTDS